MSGGSLDDGTFHTVLLIKKIVCFHKYFLSRLEDMRPLPPAEHGWDGPRSRGRQGPLELSRGSPGPPSQAPSGTQESHRGQEVSHRPCPVLVSLSARIGWGGPLRSQGGQWRGPGHCRTLSISTPRPHPHRPVTSGLGCLLCAPCCRFSLLRVGLRWWWPQEGCGGVEMALGSI